MKEARGSTGVPEKQNEDKNAAPSQGLFKYLYDFRPRIVDARLPYWNSLKDGLEVTEATLVLLGIEPGNAGYNAALIDSRPDLQVLYEKLNRSFGERIHPKPSLSEYRKVAEIAELLPSQESTEKSGRLEPIPPLQNANHNASSPPRERTGKSLSEHHRSNRVDQALLAELEAIYSRSGRRSEKFDACFSDGKIRPQVLARYLLTNKAAKLNPSVRGFGERNVLNRLKGLESAGKLSFLFRPLQ